MNLIIFAGGAGTRLWPLSRVKTPKQFGKMFHGKSTLQLALERIESFGTDNIYVSTNAQYQTLVEEQLPSLSPGHIFLEPVKRDVAAAVGLSLLRLKRDGVSGTVAVLWADHLMKHADRFEVALRQAEGLVSEQKDRFVFFAERPRFANHNLGWIHLGKDFADGSSEFLSWKYRPELPVCEKMFASGTWFWNPGYFVFDLDFALACYQQFAPEMYAILSQIVVDESRLHELYPTVESTSFDAAIIEQLQPEQAVVLKVDLGWSDPGTLYALKESMVIKEDDNFSHGHTLLHDTSDSLVYNEETGKLVVTIGLNGMVVVNTPDAMIVCPKDKVPEIKTVLKRMENEGLGEYV